jgi:hypothetical protein
MDPSCWPETRTKKQYDVELTAVPKVVFPSSKLQMMAIDRLGVLKRMHSNWTQRYDHTLTVVGQVLT